MIEAVQTSRLARTRRRKEGRKEGRMEGRKEGRKEGGKDAPFELNDNGRGGQPGRLAGYRARQADRRRSTVVAAECFGNE